VCILVPVLVVPYSKETTLTEQSYFINGSDLKIENWHHVEGLTVDQIENYAEVESVSNVRLYKMSMIISIGLTHGTIPVSIAVINRTNFLSTVFDPPSEITQLDWGKIALLGDSSALMSQALMEQFSLQVGEVLPIENVTTSERHNLLVIDGFELFPVYYLEPDAEEEEKMMIITYECYEIISVLNQRIIKTADDLYIKMKNPGNINDVKERIFQATGAIARSYEETKDTLKTPLYNIFVIEMILSLFVAIIVLVFSSFTTAIKILEKRIIKHDIMKKMGISVKTIVNMSTIQTMIAAILPAMLIGAGAGFATIYPTLIQLGYGAAPYPLYINFPIVILIVLFIGVPVLIYLGLSYFLRREFAKYAPTVME
jgi:hypothetical protein